MFTAMVSIFTNRKVNSNFAMTGEITLRGKVTAVGGIKEKILAAKRSKITDIILSEENRRDIEDITKDYLEGLTFHYVENMIDIPSIVLVDQEKKTKTHTFYQDILKLDLIFQNLDLIFQDFNQVVEV